MELTVQLCVRTPTGGKRNEDAKREVVGDQQEFYSQCVDAKNSKIQSKKANVQKKNQTTR